MSKDIESRIYGEPQHESPGATASPEPPPSPEPPRGEPFDGCRSDPEPSDDERVVYERCRSAAAAMAWGEEDTPTGRDGTLADSDAN